MIALFDVVEILASDRTRELEVEGNMGTVVGVSERELADGTTAYAVLVDSLDRTVMFWASELRPTGRRVPRSDVYDGSSVRVTDDGEVVGEPDNLEP